MSNWVEANATRSIIIHTIVVAAAVWAAFVFVFDENKVNFYEAKVERTEAQAREIEARNSVLATRVEYLTEENRKLTNWLGQTPNTIPYYESQLAELRTKLKVAEEKLAQTPSAIPEEIDAPYRNFMEGRAATTFLDYKTNAVLGVPKISYGDTADVNLTFPDGNKISVDDVKAGETWRFTENGKDYLLILDSIDWASQRFKSSIVELGQKGSK